jgi:peptidoglycan hydrolase-like protein with peptidoglycan-binding domain
MSIEEQLRRYGAHVEQLALDGARGRDTGLDDGLPAATDRGRGRMAVIGALAAVLVVLIGGALVRSRGNGTVPNGTVTAGPASGPATAPVARSDAPAVACPRASLAQTPGSMVHADPGSSPLDAVARFASAAGLPADGYTEERAPAAFFGAVVPGSPSATAVTVPAAGGGAETTQVVHRTGGAIDFWLNVAEGPPGWTVEFALGCREALAGSGTATTVPAPGSASEAAGSTVSRAPCPAAALGSFSMTDEHFRRSYAAGLAGPDAHLYELMRTFSVEDVAVLEEHGVCISSMGVGISASTGTPLGPSSPHRLVIGIRMDRFTPETKADVLATFSDPASVVVEGVSELHAGMG